MIITESIQITKITVYQVNLPLKEPSYQWGDGKSLSVFDTTVVKLDTDAGLSGFGEVCTFGSNYAPAYAEGVRSGIKELGPRLIGVNPLELSKLNDIMDYHLKGHPYVKSPIDMACWDILGKYCKLPLVTLLGGRRDGPVTLHRTISLQEPKQMAQNVKHYKSEGYKKFQLKLGRNVSDDIARIKAVRDVLDDQDVLVGDANTAWLTHTAMRYAKAVSDLDIYLEQPCASYKECLYVRKHTKIPVILDEIIHDVNGILKAHRDEAADVISLKITKFGGITKAKQARDLCILLGIPMTIEDIWGSDIVTAAIMHLAHSTPEKFRFQSPDFNSYHTVSIANDGPRRKNGTMCAPERPGLGVTPIDSVLGEPLFVIEDKVKTI